MSFLKKDVNVGLLIIVVMVAVCFVFLGLYYNHNYTTLSHEYSKKLNNLEEVADQLLFYKTRLNKTAEDLQDKSQDETALSKKYEL